MDSRERWGKRRKRGEGRGRGEGLDPMADVPESHLWLTITRQDDCPSSLPRCFAHQGTSRGHQTRDPTRKANTCGKHNRPSLPGSPLLQTSCGCSQVCSSRTPATLEWHQRCHHLPTFVSARGLRAGR